MTSIIRIITIVFILSWSWGAVAQVDPNYNQRMLYTSKYYKFKKMKTTGLIMTAGGLILGTIAIHKITNTSPTVNTQGQVVYTNSDGPTTLMLLVAVPLVGAGVPLSIVGNAKQKKYKRLMDSTLISGSFTPQYSGLTLRYKF